MTQYFFCVKCRKAADRIIMYGGNSYCLECLQTILSKLTVRTPSDTDVLEGLSSIFEDRK